MNPCVHMNSSISPFSWDIKGSECCVDIYIQTQLRVAYICLTCINLWFDNCHLYLYLRDKNKIIFMFTGHANTTQIQIDFKECHNSN